MHSTHEWCFDCSQRNDGRTLDEKKLVSKNKSLVSPPSELGLQRGTTSVQLPLHLLYVTFGNGFFRRPPWRSLRVQVHPCRTRTGTMEFHGSGAPNLHGHNLQARRTSRISEAVREKVSLFFFLFYLVAGVVAMVVAGLLHSCVSTQDGNPQWPRPRGWYLN